MTPAPDPMAGADPGALPLRANRDFRLLWIGQALSELGSGASALALPLLVLAVTGSPARAGTVAFALSATTMAARLPAGTLADRFDRKLIMLACDLGRCIGMVVLAVAVLTGTATFPLLLAVAVAEGVLGSLFAPAELAALRNVVREEQLPSALATSQARSAAADLAGPPAGGLLFGIGRALPFAADALSYLASFLCVLAVRTPLRPRPAPDVPPERPFSAAALTAGLRFIWHHPFMRHAVTAAAVLNFALNGVLLAVLLASAQRGASGLSTGAVIAIASAGGLAGSLLAPLVHDKLSPRASILAVCWTAGVCVPLMAAFPAPFALAALAAAVFLAAPVANVVVGTVLLRSTPDHVQGRVQAATGFLAMSVGPLGPLAAGLLLDRAGVTATFAAFGALLAAVAVVGTVARGLRAPSG